MGLPKLSGKTITKNSEDLEKEKEKKEVSFKQSSSREMEKTGN